MAPVSPKLVPRPQIPKAVFLEAWKVFPVKLDKFLHKISFYFWKVNDFWQGYEGLFPETIKNHQKFCFWCHFKYEVPLQVSLFWNPLIKGFKLSCNWILLKNIKFLLSSLVIVLFCKAKMQRVQSLIGTLAWTDLTFVIP